ncbi:hypothetical protein MTR_7g083300 [Medicago truncatula]|uniref:Uncharacterized protein n=1 Tax=Medicago truncatula TaxID=3880 RepID=G7KW64_MEDTR|nr:hypothetical protein MTR_7g083300 [Medicago truncatula]
MAEANITWSSCSGYLGIFHTLVGGCVTKYLQDNYFDKNFKESHLRRKAKETRKRAHLGATNFRDADETCIIGSTFVIIINGKNSCFCPMNIGMSEVKVMFG